MPEASSVYRTCMSYMMASCICFCRWGWEWYQTQSYQKGCPGKSPPYQWWWKISFRLGTNHDNVGVEVSVLIECKSAYTCPQVVDMSDHDILPAQLIKYICGINEEGANASIRLIPRVGALRFQSNMIRWVIEPMCTFICSQLQLCYLLNTGDSGSLGNIIFVLPSISL